MPPPRAAVAPPFPGGAGRSVPRAPRATLGAYILRQLEERAPRQGPMRSPGWASRSQGSAVDQCRNAMRPLLWMEERPTHPCLVTDVGTSVIPKCGGSVAPRRAAPRSNVRYCPAETLLGRPNSRSPVSPSMWSAQLHTRHQRSPLGLNHRPVHDGASRQCVLCRFRSYTMRQHRAGSAMKPGETSPGSGIGLMG